MQTADIAENRKAPSVRWRRVGVIVVASLPAAALGSWLMLSPGGIIECLATIVDFYASVAWGLRADTFWQGLLVFAWFGLACSYLHCMEVAFRRASLKAAILAVAVAFLIAGVLTGEQRRLNTIREDYYRD